MMIGGESITTRMRIFMRNMKRIGREREKDREGGRERKRKRGREREREGEGEKEEKIERARWPFHSAHNPNWK